MWKKASEKMCNLTNRKEAYFAFLIYLSCLSAQC